MKSVKMSEKAFIKEHKHLVGILKHPTAAKLKKEAAKQSKELHQRS